MTALSVVRALILSWMVAALIGCGDETAAPPEQHEDPPPPAETGALEGVVTVAETTTPIEGVAIVVTPGELQLQTGPDGEFALAELPVGSYQIDASADGYAAATVSAEVVEGQTAYVEIALAELVTFPSTCASCHLREEMILASLEEDPLPVVEDTESTGEG